MLSFKFETKVNRDSREAYRGEVGWRRIPGFGEETARAREALGAILFLTKGPIRNI